MINVSNRDSVADFSCKLSSDRINKIRNEDIKESYENEFDLILELWRLLCPCSNWQEIQPSLFQLNCNVFRC